MKRIVMIVTGILLIGVGVYAADGDLIVKGAMTATDIVEERGLIDLAKGITPTVTDGTTLTGGGPTFVEVNSSWTTTIPGSSMTIDTGITTTTSQIVGISFASSWREGQNIPRDYAVSLGDNNGNFTNPISPVTGNTSRSVTHYFTAASNARYVRLTVNGFNASGISLVARFQILSKRGAASYGRDPWVVNSSNNIFPAVTGYMGIGTTKPQHGKVSIHSANVPLVFSETDQSGVDGYWRVPTDGGGLRIDQNTSDARNFSTYRTPFSIDVLGDVRLGGNTDVAGGTETMFIGSNNGNVGIGTGIITPNAKLQVKGSVGIGTNAPTTVQANKALCWTSSGTIGYCSSGIDTTGTCTCNAIN